MRILKKVAASASAIGLLAFGVVAATGGTALASTQQSVTACSAQYGGLSVGLIPNCTAGDATVDNPTSVTINVNTSALSELLAIVPLLGLKATWTLACDVNGHTVSEPGTFTVSAAAPTASQVIDLQTAVGSPEPNSCEVNGLKVTSTLALGVGLLNLNLFTAGVNATATTAVPGAVYQGEGTTSKGASAVLCADDTGNGNAGTKIQAYQCLSDLADYFVWTSADQLVHNGDCLATSGSNVVLASCTAGTASQEWAQSSVNGTVRNKASNTCLTAPSPKDFTQLTVKSCGSADNQKWHLPQISA